MTKEMYEEPNGVEDTLMRRLDESGRIKLDDIEITQEDLEKINKVYIVACCTYYHASNIRGLDVDKPRNLAKSVIDSIKGCSKNVTPFIMNNYNKSL